MDLKFKIGIKEARETAGLRQEELAELAGISRTTLVKAENNMDGIKTSYYLLIYLGIRKALNNDLIRPKLTSRLLDRLEEDEYENIPKEKLMDELAEILGMEDIMNIDELL